MMTNGIPKILKNSKIRIPPINKTIFGILSSIFMDLNFIAIILMGETKSHEEIIVNKTNKIGVKIIELIKMFSSIK